MSLTDTKETVYGIDKPYHIENLAEYSKYNVASLFSDTIDNDYKDFTKFIYKKYYISLYRTIEHDADNNKIFHIKLIKFRNLIEIDEDVYINPNDDLSSNIKKVNSAINDVNSRYRYVSKTIEDTKNRFKIM
jgi:hypothetical protein